MVGVVVTFKYDSNFDAHKVRNVASGARARFEGMPGLRFKIFTVDSERRLARNVYVWDSEDTAKAFFDEEMLQRVTGLYGVRPTVEFAEIAALVDNSTKE